MSVPADLIERARAVAMESVVARCGVKLRRAGREWCGPCPVCGGTDRFSINPQRGVWNCRVCGKGGNVIALQQHIAGSDFAEAVRVLAGEGPITTTPRQAPAPTANPDDYARQQARKAAWLWDHQRQPLAGSIAERYLRQARGYGGPLPASLGFLSARGEHPPAMIAAFGFAPDDDGEPRNVDAVHLTKLALDGTGKAAVEKPKICIGRPAGRPIVLASIGDNLALAITEGIEEALSVAEALGIGAWAAGAAGFMPALADVVPAYIETITIFAHADDAGARGARELARRLVARGSIEVLLEGV